MLIFGPGMNERLLLTWLHRQIQALVRKQSFFRAKKSPSLYETIPVYDLFVIKYILVSSREIVILIHHNLRWIFFREYKTPSRYITYSSYECI